MAEEEFETLSEFVVPSPPPNCPFCAGTGRENTGFTKEGGIKTRKCPECGGEG